MAKPVACRARFGCRLIAIRSPIDGLSMEFWLPLGVLSSRSPLLRATNLFLTVHLTIPAEPIGRLSVASRLPLGRLSVAYRSPIRCLSVASRSPLGRLSSHLHLLPVALRSLFGRLLVSFRSPFAFRLPLGRLPVAIR
jgi:hypothetical protein